MILCSIKFVICDSDFQKISDCPLSFEKIQGFGCLKIYRHIYHPRDKNAEWTHKFSEGTDECAKMGGKLFEFKDFTEQKKTLIEFLWRNESKSR